MNIFVSGLLNVETTVSVRGFPINYYPIDYPFFGVCSRPSGVGLNIVKALTALGDSVELSSFLGNDYEAGHIIETLKADGISTDRIRRTLKSTPTSAVLYEPGGRRQIYCDLKDIQEQSIEPEAVMDDIRACDIAVLCNINFNRELIKAASKSGVRTAVDVHVLNSVEDDYNRDFMENADILFLSDEGLPCQAEVFLDRLMRRYNSEVIVLGMGAKGAMLLERGNDRAVTIPAYADAKAVNTVGAGDALFSSFIHFYAKGESALSSLRRAVVFAGIKIGFDGASAGFCTEQELERVISGKIPLRS